MTNGRLQASITVAMAIFSIGMLWNRISSNAAAARGVLDQILVEQREMRKQIEILMHKP